MRFISFLFLWPLIINICFSQDYYDQAQANFRKGRLDSARYFINKNLVNKPLAEDYFLSAMIHEAEGKDLRALADYEAVIKRESSNLEAYFQKGLIYFNTASNEQAIKDFTYVLENHSSSETNAIYYGTDPSGSKGTFLTTLQSMISRVYQYRAMAYRKTGDYTKAQQDFAQALQYDTTADCLINRSQLFAKMGKEDEAIIDLITALEIDSLNYYAWYNLALLDESTQLPTYLMDNDEFTPILNLVGANAYESGNYTLSAQYHSKAIEVNPEDDLALIGRGKALLRTQAYGQARLDFIRAMQLNPSRSEAFYLIGNTFFHEKRYADAIAFYEQYLSLDQSYGSVWFNAAVTYLSMDQADKACLYLQKAAKLGMKQAIDMLNKHCGSR